MKFLKAFFILCFVFALLGIPQQQAEAQFFTYTSGYQVQNLSGSPAEVTLTYYSQQTDNTTGGAEVTSTSVQIAASSSANFYPIHAAAGFKGSVVISSSTPLASIVNLMGANVLANASYVGFSGGANSVNMPLLFQGHVGFFTWISIQNTSTSDATVYVDYSDNGAGNDVGPIVIKPNASRILDQRYETHSATMFSGILTSNQPVAVVIVQEGTWSQRPVLATTGMTTADTAAFMPLINAQNSGFQTGVQIQNTGDQPTSITLSYTPVPGTNTGTACTETRTVPAKGSVTFALRAFAGLEGASITNCVRARFIGSARVTGNSASQPIVATVNQTTSIAGGAYASMTAGQATSRLVFPLIMDRNSGWYTGFTIQNVTNSSTTVTCTFTGSNRTVQRNLGPYGVFDDVQENQIASRYIGSATCNASGSGRIVGVVNEFKRGTGDNLLVYEGINVTP